jgi:hypothetical protein
VELRGHHLICLQFYKGLGYNKAFVENLNKVVEAWEKSPVVIVEGPDVVCKACPYLEGQVCKLSDKIPQKDRLALELLNLKTGCLIEKAEVKTKLSKVWDEWKHKACIDCLWKEVCFK